MIKLVQGFTIGSPLPIDGRILLTKDEMINNIYNDPDTGEVINLDNILPNHYFAVCKDEDDNRIYLYRKNAESKNNDETKEYGKFVLADKELIDKINKIYDELDERIDANYLDLDSKILDLSENLNEKINEVDSNLVEETLRATNKEIEIESRLSQEEARVTNYINLNNEEIAHIKEDIIANTKDINDEEEDRLRNEAEIRQSIINEQHEREHYDNEQLTLINANTAKINANKAEFDSFATLTNNKLNTITTDVSDINDQLASIETNIDEIESTVSANKIAFDDYVEINNQNISTINSDIVAINDELAEINTDLEELSTSVDSRFTDVNTELQTERDRITNNEGDIAALQQDVDNLNSGLNDVNTEISVINNSIDKSVLSSLEPFVQTPDSIVVTHKKVNIKTGTESFNQEHLPLANGINAGLMSPTDVNTIAQLKGQIASISGGVTRLLFISENNIADNKFKISYVKNESGVLTSYEVEYTLHDTESADTFYVVPGDTSEQVGTEFRCNGAVDVDGNYIVRIYEFNSTTDPINYSFNINENKVYRHPSVETINSFAIDQGQISPFSGVAIITNDTNHIWRYYPNEDGGQVIGWVDEGVDTVLQFTNSTPGTIKGAGTKEGYVYAESNGEGSVYGWSTLVDNVANNSNAILSLEETKVNKEDGKGLISTSDITKLASIAENANEVTVTGVQNGYVRLKWASGQGVFPVYTHPEGGSPRKSTGFYKFATDSNSHISDAYDVEAGDITGLNPYITGNGLHSEKNNTTGVVTISESPLVVVNVPSETWYWDDGLSTYVAVVSVTGVKDSSSPELDIDTSSVTSQEYLNNLYLNWSYIYRATTGEDFITIYAMEQPSIDLNVLVKGY